MSYSFVFSSKVGALASVKSTTGKCTYRYFQVLGMSAEHGRTYSINIFCADRFVKVLYIL